MRRSLPAWTRSTRRSDKILPEETIRKIVEWIGDFDRLVEEASLVQARARLESVILEPVKLDPHQALDVALARRLDVMNSRAALVDSWRLIAYNANALLSDVTVGFNADMTTTGDNPVKFQATHRLVTRFAAGRSTLHPVAGT